MKIQYGLQRRIVTFTGFSDIWFMPMHTLMVYADAYIIDTSKGDWASKMYHQFGQAGEDSEERRELHRKIANDEI